MWLSVPRLPVGINRYEIHQYLYSYFEERPGNAPRPFLYRVIDDSIDERKRLKNPVTIMISREPPKIPHQHLTPLIKAGRVYQFDAYLSARNGHNLGNGKRQERPIRDNEQRRQWIAARFKGAKVRFVHIHDRPRFDVRNGANKFCVEPFYVTGMIEVTDKMSFIESLLTGPGVAKAWGCGLVWLPDAMTAPLKSLTQQRAA